MGTFDDRGKTRWAKERRLPKGEDGEAKREEGEKKEEGEEEGLERL